MAVVVTEPAPKRRPSWGRWARRIGLGLVVVLMLLAGGIVWFAYSSLPDRVASRSVSGLLAPVQILYDAQAVPHIFAAEDADAYFALGYAHARDRLFQMDLQRRIGQGRLAELIGEAGLGVDRFMRTLGAYRLAEAGVAHLSPEVRAVLDAYASGVNAWLNDPDGRLPPEFALLRYRPDPWTVADSLVWGRLMAIQLSGNFRGELLRARMARLLSPERLRDLLPALDAGSLTTLAGLPEGAHLALDRLAAILPPPLGPDTASNEWVVAGDHTTTGAPILANDPHLGLSAPILWYLARLETPSLHLAGATTPGVPLIVLGHNGSIAWGLTTTGADTQDLFIEKTDPDDTTRYLVPGGSEPFTVRQETIAVAGGDPVTLTVRATRHGPVLSDIDPDVAAAAGPGEVVALAFAALTEADTTPEAIWRINRARNWTEFREALGLWVAPVQNIAYADVDGNIGLVTPGLIPTRPRDGGDLPVAGWTGEDDWTGFIPFDELPQVLNPPHGRLVNANNPVVGPAYPHRIGGDAEDDLRARRIAALVAGPAPLSPADNAAFQMDIVSLAARDLLPRLLQVGAGTAAEADAVARLRRWDGAMAGDRPEPLIFEAWLAFLGPALYADELGPLADAYGAPSPALIARLLEPGRGWCNDVNTPALEDCDAILRLSLDRALAWLGGRYGTDMDDWRWSEAHRAPLANQVLSRIPVIATLFDLSVPVDGSGDTVQRAAFRFNPDADIPFADVHGAGYRAVYDLADLSRSRFVIATGQSGHPLSSHYGDLVARWQAGDGFTIAGTPQELLASGVGSVTLRPGQ